MCFLLLLLLLLLRHFRFNGDYVYCCDPAGSRGC